MNRSPTSIDKVPAGLLIALALLQGGAISLVPREAAAQTVTTNEEAARTAFADGLRLRDEMKRPLDALPKFADAYKLAATPITAFELGKTHMQIGQLLEAQKLFVSIGAMPPDPLQSARGKAARDDAKRLAAELDTKIPSILVKVEGAPPEEPAPRVFIDGKQIPLTALGTPHKVNPGEHSVVVISGKGREKSKSLTLLEGKVEPVTFDLSPGIKISLDRKTVALIVGGVGAVGVGISLALGIAANSADNDARKFHCGAAVGGRSATQCDFQGYTDMKNAGRRADLATALFIIGGAAVATGTILWITAPPSQTAKKTGSAPNGSLGVAALPQGVLLHGGF